MSNTLRHFSKSGARLLPGLFKDRFELNRRYVLSLKTHNLLQNHYMEAGLWGPIGKPENAHWGWESPTCQIRGEFLGHWLSAAAHIIAATSDLELKGKADFIVAEVARCQQENGGEWAGPIPEKYLDWLARGKSVWAPQCTVHRNLMGLYDMYAYAGNAQALDIMVRWAEWFHRWTAQLAPEQFDRMLDVETGGMLEAWADLYGVTGDRKHLDLVNRYYHRHLFDPLLAGEDVLTNQHANTTIPEAQGAARAWEVTGNERWRQVVEDYWRCAVTERGYFATGGQTNGEYWTAPQQLSARLSDKNQEHCTVYNLMRLADYLYRWTGEAGYADYWERNLWNGTLAQQNRDTGMVTYFLPLRSGSNKRWGTPTDDFWCCQGTLIQAHSQVAEHVFYADGDDLVLAQYVPCEVEAQVAGGHVRLRLDEVRETQPAERPGHRLYELAVTCEPPTDFSLRLRHPWWLKAPVEVSVNGERPDGRGATSAYLSIQRIWSNDRVRIGLPRGLSAEALPDRPGTVAFMDGPAVLAAVLGERQPAATPGWVPQNGVETLAETTLYGRPADPTALLIADNEREFSRWRIGYRTAGQFQNLRLIPLYEIRDQSYAVYFPIQAAPITP